MDECFLVGKLLPGIFGFLFGSCLGSGTLCFLMRQRAGESWMHGRSHCDSCGHTLHAIDLIPVLSYLMTGGKCRYCKAKIPPLCCITECVFGICFAVIIAEAAACHMGLLNCVETECAAGIVLSLYMAFLMYTTQQKPRKGE